MPDSIHLEGLDELLKRIDDIEQLKPLGPVMAAAAETLKGFLSIYPAQKSMTRTEVYGQPFKSDKQRRYFFVALKKGLITVPYSRGEDAKSERFKASWTVQADNDGLTQVESNDTSYGMYLMDPVEQSTFMAALGWPTTDQVVADHQSEISEFVVYEAKRALGLD